MRRLLMMLFAAVALGTTPSIPSALAQEGTERFSTDETRRLSAELTDTERRAVELERAVDASYEGDLGGSGVERRQLQEEQQAAEDRVADLREDLAQARLEAIRDAPLAGSAEQRAEQAEAKYDALEALKDWTAAEVGLGSDEYVAVDEERMAMDDRVARLEDEAASEEQAQPAGSRPEEQAPAQGEEPAADPASETDEEGSGGFNVFPALLLLLGGGAYYVVRRSRTGNKERAPSTPLAPRAAAAQASGAKVGPQNPHPSTPSDPGPTPPRTPPPDPDAGPFDAAPPRPNGPESEDRPHRGRRSRDVPPPEDDEDLGGCPSCGAEVGSQALFCRGCGHRVRGG